MQVHQRPIFRQRALHHHLYGREKDILPHFMALPVPMLLWLLFGLLLTAAILAWTTEIPTYTSGPGVVLSAETASARFQIQQYRGTLALIFLPWDAHQKLRPGQPVQLTLPAANLRLSSHIVRILPEVMSPASACTYYTANIQQAPPAVTRPSVAALVPLGQQLSASVYAGTSLTAQVQTGFTRLVNLLPGIGMLLGGQGAS
ncbi:hypothetical protein [Thermogemmatispora sp.]|uniref:hypothetical protein n=1 Tax=Thermogemmatispora sp. TaxID=1968838 RepID=UPI002ACC06C3|nr:hypothetical protein [Thermogemmatispora sp.]